MKPIISTCTHAVLDYLTIGFALAFPRMPGASPRFTAAITGLAVGKLGCVLLTRHEPGAVRLIPMKAHLWMDAMGGAALCALPWMLREENDAIRAAAVGMGLLDIAAAPMTAAKAPFEFTEARHPAPMRRSGVAAGEPELAPVGPAATAGGLGVE
jgi:hypothetical protein